MVQDTSGYSNNDPSVQFGKLLCQPPPGEEIVISGMAGMFPLSENIEEYAHNLENKIEMVTEIPSIHPEMPPGFGKMREKCITSFDTGFFDLPNKDTLTLSPFCKFLLEKCYECIFDAGLHPSDIEGTNTGVFMGLCFCDTECHWYLKDLVKGGNAILGNIKSLICDRIAYKLKLKGPVIIADTACSSSAYALEAAFKAIRMGQCDAALVGGANLLISGGCSLQFARLGVLSPEGHCRPFDVDGLGYVRAEAAASILLQKAKDCKRVYAHLVHTKTNCDGYKEHGITYPSGAAQYNLLKEIYLESGVRPADMSYIEAHGTGTIVGDPEETSAIDEFFTPGRTTPLLIGSCKSSIGHSEPVSALCSIVKVILAFERNNITPNINYNKPRPCITGIVSGRLEVVIENTPFRDDNGLAGVSSFGFGGGNAHAILKRMQKTKINGGRPQDKLPRLICVSGRTEEAIEVLLKDIANKFDAEYIGLMHNVFRKDIRNHIYRGYAIASERGALKLKMSSKLFNSSKSNVAVCFGGISENPANVLSELLMLPVLGEFGNRITEFFSKKQLNLGAIMSKASKVAYFIAEMLIQLTLTELLKQLELNFKKVEFCSFGKLTSAFFQDLINLDEFLECIYMIAKIGEKLAVKNGNGISVEALAKHQPELLEEFNRILQSPKQMNGFHPGTAPHPSTSESLVSGIFEKTQIDLDKKSRYSALLEIGQTGLHLKGSILNISQQDSLIEILDIIGSLYEHGLQPQLHKLYPKVEFPVSRGTPMISSKIKWKHDYEHFVPSFDCTLNKTDAMVFSISPNDDEWSSVVGHVIDGRNLFPATGYLYLAWTVFAELLAIERSKLGVVFENCKFTRACTVPKPDALTRNVLELHVMIQRNSGNFEITEEGIPVVTGTIKTKEGPTSLPKTTPKEDPSETPLNSKDIYKELRLRGYHYKGVFRKIVQTNRAATHGKIQWCDDWIAFMDNMLQMQIVSEDTRLLYVPTRIARLTIDPDCHLQQVNELREGGNEGVDLPVEVELHSGIIRSGGIELKGLLASSIPRKKTTAIPVLEKYQFISNHSELPLEQAVRVFMQIALENHSGLKIKAVEVIDEESDKDLEPLALLIQDVLEDQPLVQTDMNVFTSKNVNLAVNVQNKKLKDESECTLVVGSKLLSRPNLLQDAIKATKDIGFVLSREPLDADTNQNFPGLQVVNISETPQEMLVFLKKDISTTKPRVFINVNTKTRTFSWLEELKEAVKKDQDVVAWCQDEPLNGVIGLVNCISKEPDCKHVRCMFIVDKAPSFEPTMPFYKVQLDKQLVINVFKNGSWGTYRHLVLDDVQEVENEHCYANSTVRGDLSSIKWIEGPLKTDSNETLLKVFYSSLNFRDVMTASGRINADVITRNRREQECVQGFEFSGKTLSGKKLMGMLSHGTLATLVKVDENLCWEVPSKWTLKEAATVPVVYGTCLYALVVVGKIKPGHSVLIHSGTGGIGQAAINLCLNMGCTVFTTVGTEEKRKYIKRHFPQINERHIGNSRDLSFEQMIMKETKGAGVDIVLNSLAEDKLQTSVRCLAKNGRFLEIGKFDLANDNQLTLLPFRHGISYHGVMLDKLFNELEEAKLELKNLLQKYIDNGAIKPLHATVFKDNEVEQAFRFMTTGKHMGKVLVEIRNEEEQKHRETFRGLPRYFCDPNKTYIICGGLGGFGLELADWLVLRGAQNLVLTSRRGITTGYQHYRVSIWKNYGCNIQISTKDITTKQGCEQLIEEANKMAPVAAIFNLAVVLMDAILPNQSEESFAVSFGPKACATEHLDEITRKMCPELKDFVVFSSVSCGRGNAGQTNYGMSNSVMERICEKRRADGYPGLAIQWGAIGEVGLVAEMQEDHVELEIGGTLQQSISNCLQVLDTLLRQNDACIVSSMVVAEKKTTSLSGNIMDVVGGILGIRDIKCVSLNSTFAELGMDSMTGVEVKQVLEREYNIFLSPTEIRSVTLARIKEMYEEGNSSTVSSVNNEPDVTLDWPAILKGLVNSEEQKSCIIKLRSKSSDKDPSTLPRVIALPGIEGVCELLQNLTENLEVDAYGVNYVSATQDESIEKSVNYIMPHVEQLLQKDKPYHLVAHSIGSILAVEIISRLEQLGYDNGTVTFIDGSPVMMKSLFNVFNSAEQDFFNLLVAGVLRIEKSDDETRQIMEEVCKCSTMDAKLDLLVQKMTVNERLTEDFYRRGVIATWKRIKAISSYAPEFKALKTKASLFKPVIMSVKDQADDYELGQYFDKPVDISILEGSHTTILQNKELADAIMKYIM